MSGTAHLLAAVQRLPEAPPASQAYSEAEVGRDFLTAHGYAELFGPSGHFRSAKLRGYIGIWGPGLTYDWHDRDAEELCFTHAGSAVFAAKGARNAVLKPGDASAHTDHQPHLVPTLDQPYLAYAVRRGAGMDSLPRMVSP